jgi:xanthine dehydrogenase molybdenum-binding subunit
MTGNGQGNGRNESVGTSYVKVDAWERVTGRAEYAADVRTPNALHAKVLRSPHPHAIIKHIDVSRAEQLSGVKAIITSKDFPSMDELKDSFGGELMVNARDLRRMVLADDKVLFDGHGVAAVAATSLDIAEAALDLITVGYEILPVINSAADALMPDAPLLHPDVYTKTLKETPDKPSNLASYVESGWGDVDKGFAEAAVIVERSFDSMMVHQGYLEPQACTARWDNEVCTVWTSTQGTFNGQRMVATLLQVPLHQVNFVPTEIGGGFGGKIYTLVEPIAMLLARKAGRPVKFVMDRSEVFRATGPGSPQQSTVKVGARKDGTIVAAQGSLIMDAGAFPGAPVAGASMVTFGPYKMENFKLEAYDVVTNKPRVQAYRAPGGTPAAFGVEVVMDEIAEKLGMDPLKLRKINAVSEGDPSTNGRPLPKVGLKEVLGRVEGSAHWNAPLEGENRGRGLALGFWNGAVAMSSATINVNVDGTVEVVSGHVDLTGTRTTMTQMAADMLQLPPGRVSARVTDTASGTYTDVTGGSRTVYTQSQAIYNACESILNEMKALAADQLKLNEDDIEYADGAFSAKGNPETTLSWDELASRSRTRGTGPISGYGTSGRLKGAPAFAAHLADVEVDPDTGKVKILRYTCFQDVGKAINPAMVEGQIQGGAVQGLGWALSEYYHYEDGKLRNPTLLDYRMLTALDLPMVDTEIVEVPADDSPYGARGVGEVPIIPPAAAVESAIYRAVGVRMTQLPMTPERVFWALHGDGSEK